MSEKIIDRVKFDLSWWKDREKNVEEVYSDLAPGVKLGRAYQKGRLKHFRAVYKRYRQQRGTLSAEEAFTLSTIKDAMKVQWRQLYPKRWQRRFFKLVQAIKNISAATSDVAMVDNLGHFGRQQQLASDNRRSFHNTLRKMGFEQAIPDLDRQLAQGRSEFQVPLSFFLENGKSAQYNLQFRKNADGITYDFEGYHAHLTFENAPEQNRSRSFKVTGDQGFTATESRNLLAGRPVEKTVVDVDGGLAPTWVQLNFNTRDGDGQFTLTRYPPDKKFDIDGAISSLPLRSTEGGLQLPQMAAALKEGAIVPALFDSGNIAIPVFLAASPMEGEIKLFNDKMKPVTAEQLHNAGAKMKTGATLSIDNTQIKPPTSEDGNKKLNNAAQTIKKVTPTGPMVKKSAKKKTGLGPR
jgi:hypothetical protein